MALTVLYVPLSPDSGGAVYTDMTGESRKGYDPHEEGTT